ncbi:MAG: SDR family NAD(P)-dependent oxidoreductase, partial [Myxococcota bacterium]|nr:SDR family NAD(P)-dependent oxidoreductase [Myxococcota bacterium]
YDRSGYVRHAQGFTTSDLDVDLSGRHWVVTGANSGIGWATAKALAERGAHVTLICRSEPRAADAVEQIKANHGEASLAVIIADLAVLSDVRSACRALVGPIHGIVFNAGNMVHRYQTTPEGFEVITALHVIGPLAMAQALEAQLIAGARECPVRCIFVASGGMYTQRISQQALEPGSTGYDGTVHYARTKRGQVVLAEYLHAQLSQSGISVHAMHPGWVDTPAVRRAMPVFYRMTQPILRRPSQGADTVIWLCCAATGEIDRASGFWFDRQRVPTHAFRRTDNDQDDKAAFIDRLLSRLEATVSSIAT